MLRSGMTSTAAPSLPLVIGIPFLCMFVVVLGIIGVFLALGRLSRP